MSRRMMFSISNVSPQKIVKYGYLYNWYVTQGTGNSSIIPTAMESAGWRIPRYTEEATPFINYVGANAAYKIQDSNLVYWGGINTNNPTNSLVFSARGSGKRDTNGNFEGFNSAHRFWIMLSGRQFTITDSNVSQTISRIELFSKEGVSIRLVRPASVSEQTQVDGSACSPYIGNDGTTYPTVKIGVQVWLASNLAETKYRDGSDITTVTNNTTWASLTTSAKCAYNNDITNIFI